MKNLFRMPKTIIVLGSLFFLFSCSQDEMVNNDAQESTSLALTAKMSSKKLNVFKGPQVALGYGKVRSWISVDSNGFPDEIGIEITPDAFKNLTMDDAKTTPPEGAVFAIKSNTTDPFRSHWTQLESSWTPSSRCF